MNDDRRLIGMTNRKSVINDLVQYSKLVLVDMRPIGSGAFGDIYRALHKDWGWQVAYKKLDTRNMDARHIKELKNEAEIHRQLRHPNIVCMLGVVLEAGNYGLILEYIVYGSLDKFLENLEQSKGQKFHMSWKLKARILYEIFCAMSYLHNLSTPIIHGDLKIENILLGESCAKISDFGLAKWKNFSRSYTRAGTIPGTPTHIPPEKWKDPDLDVNEKFDSYSAGILMWEMFAEEKAFAKCRRDMIMSLVANGNRPSMSYIPEDVPESVNSLINACLEQEPDKRPTFTDLVHITNQLIFRIETEIQQERKQALQTQKTYSVSSQQYRHGQKLASHYQVLADNIRRTDQITVILLQRKVLLQQEYETINSYTTEYDRIRELIAVISSKLVTAYQCFLDALNTTEQQHLYELLVNEYLVNTVHKIILVDNYTFLLDNITITGSQLTDILRDMKVLNQQEFDSINSKRTTRGKVEKLLQLLLRSSEKQYKLFLNALERTGQEFIAITLRGAVDENVEIEPFQSTLFIQPTTVQHIENFKDTLRGIAMLENELFLAYNQPDSPVDVYDTENFTLSRRLRIDNFSGALTIAACPHYNCFYLSTSNPYSIVRYELSNNSTTSWSLAGECYGLSIAKDSHNILVALYNRKKIKEYTTDGRQVREICLDASINDLNHCIQLSTTRNFVVCHGGSKQSRVCIVNIRGQIVSSYGGARGSGVDELGSPYQLSVDSRDHIFVADSTNNRVQLFSSSLALLGTVDTAGERISYPSALHLDEINHCLYIVELYSGRLLVLCAENR